MVGGLAFAAGLALAPSARAQNSALDTIDASVATKGLRLGPYKVNPRLSADVTYDSNIYNRDNAINDAIFEVRPEISVSPDLARHMVSLTATGDIRRYFETTSENSEQFSAILTGRLDLPQRTAVDASALVARRIEQRGDVGDQFALDRPVSYREVTLRGGVTRNRGLLSLRAGLSLSEYEYSDTTREGVPVDLSSRDSRRLSGTLRAEYAVSTVVRVFASVSANSLNYENDANGLRRSRGYSVLAGARVEITELLDAEAAIGYAFQDFASPTTPDFSSLDFRARLRWTPTPLTHFSIDAGRSVDRSPRLDVTAVITTEFRASGTLGLTPRLAVEGEIQFKHWQYVGIDRRDNQYGAEGGLAYAVGPGLAVIMRAGFRTQSSAGIDARNYRATTMRAGLRLAL